MILNSFEFALTEQKIEKIQTTIYEVEKKDFVEPFLLQVELNSLYALMNDLVQQRNYYSKISQEFKDKIPTKEDTLEFPEHLVYIRIANGISQENIADAIQTNVEDIKRQEDYLYRKLDCISLLKINDFLREKISSSLSINSPIIDWGRFPIKEMLRRGWLPSGNTDPINFIKAQFIDMFGNEGYELALHRKFHFNGSSPNQYSLLAWQIQILRKAKKITEESVVPEFTKDLSWLNQLVRISTNPQGPLEAQKFLLTKGVILIVEPHLQSTYLDGAAMLLPSTSIPVIGLTLRHDRLDNFWFVLLHELGHIFLHLNEEQVVIFDEDVDEDVDESNDGIEVEADEFALNNLIPPEQWEMCTCRFYLNKNALNEDARNLNIHPSIIAGRVRKENNDYQIFSEQIGLRQVRKLFWGNNYDFE